MRKTDRRGFLKNTAAVTAALAFPTIVPSSVFGQNAPSNRIQLGLLGVGQRANTNLRQGFLRDMPDVRIVALYDPKKDRSDAAVRLVNGHYGSDVCTAATSYRELLARDDVDGVVIAAPDHWHTPLAYLAAQAKKDVYVEKPLSVSLAWAKKLRAEVARSGVVLQYGTQQRSTDGFGRVVNLVRNGYLGKIKHVDAWAPGMRAPGFYETVFEDNYRRVKQVEVPAELDYETWTGPAPMRPYTEMRGEKWGHFFIYDFSLGFVAGWGAHPLDIAQWGLDMDHTSPVRYEGTGELPPEGAFDTIDYWDMNCEYANGVTLRFMCARAAKEKVDKMDQRRIRWKDHGTTFFGEDGWLNVSRMGVYASTPELQRMDIKDGEARLDRGVSHYRDFVDCIKSRRQPVSPLEAAIRSDTISHMTDIAIRLKRPIRWDPAKEEIVGDEEASKMLVRPMRAPYVI